MRAERADVACSGMRTEFADSSHSAMQADDMLAGSLVEMEQELVDTAM